MVSKKVKKAALEFLQSSAAIELRKNIPNLADVQFENGKIVLTVRGELQDVPTIEYEGTTFDVSVKEATGTAPMVSEATEKSRKAQEILSKYPKIQQAEVYTHETEIAVSPEGSGDGTRRDQAAYEAWQKRHNKGD